MTLVATKRAKRPQLPKEGRAWQRVEPASTVLGTPARTWLQLSLHWIPVALKNRSRSFYNKHLGRVMHYQDSKVTADMAAIAAIAAAAMDRGNAAFRDHWELRITVFRPFGKSERKSSVENARRGDLVSAHELVCDALQGVWYLDDSQVTKLTVIEDRSASAPGMLVEGSTIGSNQLKEGANK